MLPDFEINKSHFVTKVYQSKMSKWSCTIHLKLHIFLFSIF